LRFLNELYLIGVSRHYYSMMATAAQ